MLFRLIKSYLFKGYSRKPKASKVLTAHLIQRNYPQWTSFYVKYSAVQNDQFGLSHFNWTIKDNVNYHILRTGCFPFIKYHCTRRPYENLYYENVFYTILKILNLGIPTLGYGLMSYILVQFQETVRFADRSVQLFFLLEEDPNAKN